MALNLFGVTVNDAHTSHVSVPETQTVVVRDLAAICGQTENRDAELDAAAIARLNGVVTAYAAHGPVLPAPAGVAFRSAESVERWLELHYGALTEALSFVENRVAARVHVMQADAGESVLTASADDRRDRRGTNAPSAADLEAMAAESLRALRRSAVAALPLRADRASGELLSIAFLIEQDLWKQFAAEVDAQAKLAAGLRFDLTGPWQPYDFVQMQLGA